MGDGITILFLNIHSFPNFQKCYIDYVLLLNQIFLNLVNVIFKWKSRQAI